MTQSAPAAAATAEPRHSVRTEEPKASGASRRTALLAILLVLITALVFGGTTWHDFVVWDDEANIVESPYMQPVTAAKVGRAWREPYFAMYIPVTRTVWAGIGAVSAGPRDSAGKTAYDPRLFHAANVLIHCANVLLVIGLLRRFVKKDWAAAAGAALFAVHPLQVEPVAWVTGMKDLLGAMLSLCSLLVYVRWVDSGRVAEGRHRRRGLYVWSAVFFVLALLAKPSAAALPLILFAIDTMLLSRSAGASMRALAPWAAASIPVLVVTRLAEQATGAVPHVAVWARPLLMGDTFAWYLRKLVWPGATAVDYGRSPDMVIHSALSYAAWVVPAMLAVAAWRARRRIPAVTAGIALFAASILPVSGVSPFAFQSISDVADRYAYFGMAGAALAAAALLARARWTPAMPAAAVCLTALAVCSAAGTRFWASSATLLSHTLVVNPRSWMAWNNMAVLYERKSDVRTAADYYGTALRINPACFMAHNNLGLILERQGRLAEAGRHFEDSVNANRLYPEAHFNLGRMLARAGEPAAAAKEFKRAILLNPEYAAAYNNCGAMLTLLGNASDARKCFAEAITIEPNLADARFNLGVNYLQAGRPVEAARELAEAVRLKPSNDQARRALNDALGVTGKQARR